MILKAYGDEFYCTKATVDFDKKEIRAFDGSEQVAYWYGFSNFADFTIEGGSWSYPDPTVEEQLQADVDYLTMENESLAEEAEQSRADIDYAMMLLGEDVE